MKFLLALCIFFAAPFMVSAEEVSSFVSDIELHTDGTFTVTETIVYDFEEAQRHGIFRTIEKDHPQDASGFFKERFLELEVRTVQMDEVDVPFEVNDSSDDLEIKIGDPDATITGPHTYEIVYTVRGGYSYYETGEAEIYWNATGNEWEVPIVQALVRIHAPSEDLLLQQQACYIGAEGETDSCDIAQVSSTTVSFAATGLEPGAGLTIAQAIDGEAIAHVALERPQAGLIALFLVPFVLGIVSFIAYRHKTKHATGAPIIAQYEPYQNFKPMYAGTLFDGRLDPHDITAGIVYLAEQGFVKIAKIERKVMFFFEVDDYKITLHRPQTQIESQFLRDVITLLFDGNAEVGAEVTLSDLQKNTQKQRENAKQLQALRKAVKRDMKENGFIEASSNILWMFVACAVVFTVLIALTDFVTDLVSLALFITLVSVAICSAIILLFVYERRTRKGYEALDHLKGFKLFLSVTDKERFAFHNAPEKSPELFMEYLPYAIAFGVEKQWAKVFEGVTIPNPDWYEGGSAGTFSAVNLTSSLGAFSSSFTASSGSSGSGASGGGAGGGGGGSW